MAPVGVLSCESFQKLGVKLRVEEESPEGGLDDITLSLCACSRTTLESFS